MEAIRSAGVRPVVRAGAVGAGAALLALLVMLRGLIEVLHPLSAQAAQVGAGSLVVFAAAALGGAAGAWQAALAGLRTRRAIVAIGAACPAAVCLPASLALSVWQSVEALPALWELVLVGAGAGAGAWALPAVASLLARMRGTRGQTSVEYAGALALVAIIVVAFAAAMPSIGERVSGAVRTILGTGEETAQTGGGPTAQEDGGGATTDPTADDDGDGLDNEEEAALGTDPGEADSDGDGVSDEDEFTSGTDPLQGVEPLTEESLAAPWERIGITEDEWDQLEESILDEVNPGGIEGFLLGNPAGSLTLDENGELTLVPPGAMLYVEDGRLEIAEIQEAGIGGGLVRGLAKLL